MGREEERLHVHIPAYLKERLVDVEKTQTDVVSEALHMYFGIEDGDGRDVLKQQLQRMEEKKKEARKRKQQAEKELEEAEQRIESLQTSLTDYEAAVGTYEEELEELVEWHEEGNAGSTERRIFEGHARVKELAGEFDKPQKAILEDAKARSDLPAELFEEGRATGKSGRSARRRRHGGGQ